MHNYLITIVTRKLTF